MPVGVGGHDRAVGQHDLGGDEAVDAEPELPGQVAEPAAEGQPGDTGGGEDAARDGQAERVRGVVDVAQQGAALHADEPLVGVDVDGAHVAEVDHERVGPDAQAGGVVSSAADGERQAPLPREVDGGDHVGDVDAARDQARATVDAAVVDGAGLVVPGVAGFDRACRGSRGRRAGPVAVSDAVMVFMPRR